MNIADYAGWVAIFSRLDRVPWLPKTIANTHMSTGMLSLLCHRQFQAENIHFATFHPVWDWFRAAFVVMDAVVRSYYEFHVIPSLPSATAAH